MIQRYYNLFRKIWGEGYFGRLLWTGWEYPTPNWLKTFSKPIRSFTVKKNHIGSVPQTYCDFYIMIYAVNYKFSNPILVLMKFALLNFIIA